MNNSLIYLENKLEDAFIEEVVTKRKQNFNLKDSIKEDEIMDLLDE